MGRPRSIWLLALVGLAIRLSFPLTGWHEGNLVADDAYYYFTIARNILAGHGSTFDGLTLTNGYHPLWMGALIGLFALAPQDLGWPVRIATTACALLDVASGWVLYRLLVRCGWPTAAWVAAVIWFLSPFTVFVGLRGMEVSLATLLVLLVASTLVAPGPMTLTRRTAVVSGVLIGLAGLARTDSLPVLGLALASVVVIPELRSRRRIARALGWLAGAGLTAALVTLPWFAWNQAVFGSILQVSGQVKLFSQQVYGSLGRIDWNTLAGARAVVKALILPLFTPVRFVTGEEFEPPALALGWTAGLILVPMIAAWLARGTIAKALEEGARRRLVVFAVLYVVLHVVEFGFVWRTYAVWYALPCLAILAMLCGIAFAPGPDGPRRPAVWQRPLVAAFAALCVGAYAVFFARVSPQPRDPGGVLSANLARVAARFQRPVVAGAWNAGGYGWAAREQPEVRVTNLDGLVNNAAFEAVRQGTYRQYVERTVDVLFDDPHVSAMFLDSLEVRRLAAAFQRWDGYEIWIKK